MCANVSYPAHSVAEDSVQRRQVVEEARRQVQRALGGPNLACVLLFFFLTNTGTVVPYLFGSVLHQVRVHTGRHAHKARHCKNWVSAGMTRAVHTAQLLHAAC